MPKPPSFKLSPPPLTTRKVWAGICSDQAATLVMLFRKRPKLDPDGDRGPEYNLLDEHFIGSVEAHAWEAWFGTMQPFVDARMVESRNLPAGQTWVACSKSDSLECHKVIPISVTAVWDEWGDMVGLDTRAER